MLTVYGGHTSWSEKGKIVLWSQEALFEKIDERKPRENNLEVQN